MIGCGGAYPGSGLAPGDLALASEEISPTKEFSLHRVLSISPPSAFRCWNKGGL
ncbi:MAG: hypothetical protein R2864_10805 [Syntrophotaleaceae bacterium]